MARILIVARPLPRERIHFGVDARAIARHLARTGYEVSLAMPAAAAKLPPDAVLGFGSAVDMTLARLSAARFGAPYGAIFDRIPAHSADGEGLEVLARPPAMALATWAARGAVAVGITAETFRAPLEQAGVEASRMRRLPPAIVRSGGANAAKLNGLDRRDAGAVCAIVGRLTSRTLTLLRASTGMELVAVVPPREQQASWPSETRTLRPRTLTAYVEALRAADVILLCQPPRVTLPPPPELGACLASGTPLVVAAPAGSELAREIRDHSAGLVARPEDAAGMLAAIERLRMDAGLRAYVAESARRWVAGSFSPEAVWGAYARFVGALVAEAGCAPARRLIRHASESTHAQNERSRAA